MRKDAPKRWTRNNAAMEFGISDKNLTLRLRRKSIKPGEDGCYSTKQICDAVFGDIDGEKLRLTKEQADRVAWENRINEGEYIKAADYRQVTERGLSAMVAAVNSAANLEDEDKAKIIRHLRACGESVVAGTGGGNTAPVLSSK